MRFRSIVSNPAASFGTVVSVALSQVAVLAFVRHPEVLSNVLQIAAALMALGLCLNYAWRAPDRFLRYTWLQLGSAFALWSTAQILYFVPLLTGKPPAPFPSTASVLYFLVAFPVLMVTVVRRSGTKWEWVNWLDSAQACLFFFVLDSLVFSHPASISVTTAYDVQAIALFLTGAIRYSSAAAGAERIFFRNLFAFLSMYGALVCLGIHLNVSWQILNKWTDLCWSAPFLLFCTLFLTSELKPAHARKTMRARLPRHLHGLSALGLAVLSIGAGSILDSHHPTAGLLVIALAFLLFAVRISARESQLHAAHDNLEHSVLHDALTGLANRTQLHRELAERLLPGSAHAGQVALLFIDLDRFKAINDDLGHAFGDRLLIAIAQILVSAVRPGDLVARLGGDEFVVLADCTDQTQAQVMADSAVQQLRQSLRLEDRVLHITASAGIVLGQPGMDADKLLRSADCAMYAAKHRGGNHARTFEASMEEQANGTSRLETDLREAIESGGISVQYQPIYSLAEEAVIGFEALARWQHRTRGFVSPAEFIPIAEDSGLILELGLQVLRRACRQIRQWNQTFNREFAVSVNVSARQFADQGFLEKVRAILAETALPPNRLKLEVTESVLLSGIQPIEETLNALRAMGIEIALDDFGTGYSSLSYLLRFPFDVIKIDRSFIQALNENQQRADLACAIVQIATKLGKKVIAEGVETESELQCLKAMQCDLIQGYLFSKPLAAEAVSNLLREHRTIAAVGGERTQPIWAVPAALAYPGDIPSARNALALPAMAAHSYPAYASPKIESFS